MAALPYMQLYVADYLADTMHLSAEEHGAYLLLIFNYWQTGKPLPNDDKRLCNIARVSNERWTDVKRSLSEYFVLVDDTLVHPRIEADLLYVEGKQNKAVEAGKASAIARKLKKQTKINARSTNATTNVPTGALTERQPKANHSESESESESDSDSELIKKGGAIAPCELSKESSHNDRQKDVLNFPALQVTANEPPAGKPKRVIVPYKKIVALYHLILPELPRIVELTKTRKGYLGARWADQLPDLETWEKYFKYIRKSDWLMGRVDPMQGRTIFKANLEWISKESNYAKIVEQKYHDTEGRRHG